MIGFPGKDNYEPGRLNDDPPHLGPDCRGCQRNLIILPGSAMVCDVCDRAFTGQRPHWKS